MFRWCAGMTRRSSSQLYLLPSMSSFFRWCRTVRTPSIRIIAINPISNKNIPNAKCHPYHLFFSIRYTPYTVYHSEHNYKDCSRSSSLHIYTPTFRRQTIFIFIRTVIQAQKSALFARLIFSDWTAPSERSYMLINVESKTSP